MRSPSSEILCIEGKLVTIDSFSHPFLFPLLLSVFWPTPISVRRQRLPVKDITVPSLGLSGSCSVPFGKPVGRSVTIFLFFYIWTRLNFSNFSFQGSNPAVPRPAWTVFGGIHTVSLLDHRSLFVRPSLPVCPMITLFVRPFFRPTVRPILCP